MKHTQYFIATIALFFLILSCSSDDANNNNDETGLDPSLYYEELNISYGSDSDQVFDLYLPANRTSNTKVMVLVHGGSWIGGDKTDMNDIKDIVRQELPTVAIANLNYRLADETNLPIPMQTDDISSVISALKSNQANYTISDDYGFIGVSAGGHLSLLWSYLNDTQNDVKMVCSIVGPTNLTDPEYENNPFYDAIIQIFGDNINDDYLQSVSPFHSVTSSSPPTILFYGGRYGFTIRNTWSSTRIHTLP